MAISPQGQPHSSFFAFTAVNEPHEGRIVGPLAGGRDHRDLRAAGIGVLGDRGRRLEVHLAGGGKKPGHQVVEKGDQKRRGAVVVGQGLGGDLPAGKGRGQAFPKRLGRGAAPLVDRLLPVAHEEERPLPFGILAHHAQDVLDQGGEQGVLELRGVLELVEEEMGRAVEPKLVEAREIKRPVRAFRPVEADQPLGDVLEIEAAQPLLFGGEDVGAQAAERA